jgi:hypothetical protein
LIPPIATITLTFIGGCYVTAPSNEVTRNTNGIPRHSINGVSKKFRRMAELYAHFGKPMAPSLDFSDDAMLSLYNHESYGTALSHNNGYAVGKQYLNLQVTSWREAIRQGVIAKFELYEDPAFADWHWWLDSVLKDLYAGMTYESLLAECTKI